MKTLVIRSDSKIGSKTIDNLLSGYIIDAEPDNMHVISNNFITKLKKTFSQEAARFLFYRGEVIQYHDLPIYRYRSDSAGNMILDFSLVETTPLYVIDHTGKPVQWIQLSLNYFKDFDALLKDMLNCEVIESSAMKTRESFPENYVIKTAKGNYRVVGKLYFKQYMLDWDFMTVKEVEEWCTGELKTVRATRMIQRSNDDDDDENNFRRLFGGFGMGRLEEYQVEPPSKESLAINLKLELVRGCKYVNKLEKSSIHDFAKALNIKIGDLKDELNKLYEDHIRWSSSDECRKDDVHYRDVMKHPDTYPGMFKWVSNITSHGYSAFVGDHSNIVPFVTARINYGHMGSMFAHTLLHVGRDPGGRNVEKQCINYISHPNLEQRLDAIDINRGIGYVTFIKYT